MLLNVNVAFLAVPTVDPGDHLRTPAQLASYFSITTSIGSILTGLSLLRQHRVGPQDAAEEVVSRLIWCLTPIPPFTALDVFSVTGQISSKSSSQCSRVRNPRDPVQLAIFVTALGVRHDKSHDSFV